MTTTEKTAATKAAKRGGRGKRYTPEKKQEVIDFVNEINSTKGRGGQSAASKKYGISPLTISSWIKAGPGAPKKRASKKTARKAKVARTLGASKTVGGSLEKRIDDLKALAAQIDAKQSEVDTLKSKFDALKASL
jgi:transposase-like protein